MQYSSPHGRFDGYTLCACARAAKLLEGEGTGGIEEGDELVSRLKPALGCIGYTICLATRAQGCACGAITPGPRIKQA